VRDGGTGGRVSVPRFVVLEGVEGSGKSTQIRLLGSWLAGLGLPHIATREPGGQVEHSPVAAQLRFVLMRSSASLRSWANGWR